MTKRSVIITAPGFQDEEVVYPYYRLLEAGFQTDIATKDGVVVYGKYGVPARATMATTKLDANNFDLVVLPGGFEAPDRVRLLTEVLVCNCFLWGVTVTVALDLDFVDLVLSDLEWFSCLGLASESPDS